MSPADLRPLEVPATDATGYRRAIAVVLALTLALGAGEVTLGLTAGSTYLTKDGFEWGYGCLVYAIGLATYGRSKSMEARGGYLSAAVLAIAGCQGLVEVARSLLQPELTDSLKNLTMSTGISLAGSALVALALARFRGSADPVVYASWLSARNDVFTSGLDAVATLAGHAIGAQWLDQVSTGIGVILSFSAAWAVAREAAVLRAGC